MHAQDALVKVAHLAELQRGLVTTRQAATVGVSRLELARLTDRGLLKRVAQGTYRVAGSEGDAFADLRATWVSLDPAHGADARVGPGGALLAVSRRSAAWVHGIGNLNPREHEFSSAARRQTSRPGVAIHRDRLTRGELVIREGMLVTSVERTIADLARTEPSFDDACDALADAVDKDIVDLRVLASALERATGRHRSATGVALMERMLSARGLDRASVAERFAQALLDDPALTASVMRALTAQEAPARSENRLTAVAPELLRTLRYLRDERCIDEPSQGAKAHTVAP
jgi:predicted transcriptional regulator of viral defense system